jgi:hypothetical protein
MPGLEFNGWKTGHEKDFASFLKNHMGLTEDEEKKVIKAFNRIYLLDCSKYKGLKIQL